MTFRNNHNVIFVGNSRRNGFLAGAGATINSSTSGPLAYIRMTTKDSSLTFKNLTLVSNYSEDNPSAAGITYDCVTTGTDHKLTIDSCLCLSRSTQLGFIDQVVLPGKVTIQLRGSYFSHGFSALNFQNSNVGNVSQYIKSEDCTYYSSDAGGQAINYGHITLATSQTTTAEITLSGNKAWHNVALPGAVYLLLNASGATATCLIDAQSSSVCSGTPTFGASYLTPQIPLIGPVQLNDPSIYTL
jgi:hypothetical protein